MWKFLGTSKAVRWLYSTVFIAFLPILFRGLIWSVSSSDKIPPLSISDLLLFSLIINLSILNELRHVDDPTMIEWKEKFVFLAEATIFIITPLLFCTYVQEIQPLFKEVVLMWVSVSMAFISFLVGYAIFYKINYKSNTYPQTAGG